MSDSGFLRQLSIGAFVIAVAAGGALLSAGLLLARVSPSAAAGTVQFKDGTTALGAPVPVISGFAFAVTDQLRTVGGHPLTTVFIPTDPMVFKPSTSDTVEVLVRPAGS